VFLKNIKFEELGLSHEILKAVAEMGFEETTPIQSLSIPVIMKGGDIIGQAQTGTGKTAAYGIPILEKINPQDRRPQAIILCPTRELSIQIAEELMQLGKYKKGVYTVPIYGGQSIERQIQSLRKGAHIVIGTPGRVLDHLARKTLTLVSVSMTVLDEADEMLNMGFRDDIELILKSVPSERQSMFFSATIPGRFMELSKTFQKHPQLIKMTHDKLTVPSVDQSYYEVKESLKMEMLTRLIELHSPKISLVFCNTKKMVDEVNSHLQARGYFSEAIHGDMRQQQRERVMSAFKNGSLEILVATDVAARGIDVDDIDAVFNYDVPEDEEYYVHRIGRTARAGKTGNAFTFVAGRDIYKLKEIQRYAKIEIKRKIVPTLKDIENVKISKFLEKIKKGLEAADLQAYSSKIESLLEGNITSLDIAAVLLKMVLKREERGKKETKTDITKETCAEPGMARLFINVGKNSRVSKGDILGTIAGETGLSGAVIGKIEVYDRCSFVEVPAADAERVIGVMKTKQIKGNRIVIDRANSFSKKPR
jgi:ATP-dependent RNA helicase DeaD